MKQSRTRPSTRIAPALALGALTLAFATAAWAHPPPPFGGEKLERCMKMHFEKHLKPYDTDKDGKLDPEEHRAMMQAKRAEALAKYDANGNGKLDKAEREKLHFDKMVEHFEEIDTNGDAELSRAEAEASCSPLAVHFDDADLDDNGIVSWTEFEKGAKRAHRLHGHGPFPHPPPPPMHGCDGPPDVE